MDKEKFIAELELCGNWQEEVKVMLVRHKNITQSDLAEKLGCTFDYVNQILNGRVKEPDSGCTKEKIIKALAELIDEKG